MTVYYTVQEVGSANFFDGTTNAASPLAQPPIPLTFTQDPETNAWTAPIEIQLRAIDATKHDTDSTFTVELPQQSGDASTYRVDTTANMNKASVTISDNSEPTISIADATPTYNGETATFTLSSQIEVTDPLTVKVKITNASGEFLDPANIAADDTRDLTNVTFTRATPTAPDFTYNLDVPTRVDPNTSYASGSIMVEVVDRAINDGYQLSDNKSATVAVYRLTTLSIDSANAQVREGEELVYIVTSDFKPPNAQNTLNISYTVTEEAGTSYVNTNVVMTGTSVSDDLVFEFDDTTSDWKARIPIQLNARNNDATDADGTVKLELGTPASDAVYQLADQNRHIATTTIVDNDTPLIKLVGNADNTYATQMANFTIESQIDLDSPITVKIRATNTTGAFLGAGFAADGTMEDSKG